ncbi:hypothetical protein ACTVMR_19090 [Serratia nevei]|uniref:hypothetical protein n=1 Tax=Serratia nevei TaxID=2703794 RepID=UPI003FA782C6
MSDSTEEGMLNSVKKTLMDRVNTPLFGFITLSWVVCNWDNILFVMLSNLPIEQRIKTIRLSGPFYVHELITPIVVGFSLSVLFPYLQLLVDFFQRDAKERKFKNKQYNARQMYNAEYELTKLQIRIENAKDKERASDELIMAKDRNEKASLDFDTNNLREMYEKLEADVMKKEKEVNALNVKLIELNDMDNNAVTKLKRLDKEVEDITRTIGELNDVKNSFRNFGDNVGLSVNRMESVVNALKNNVTNDGFLDASGNNIYVNPILAQSYMKLFSVIENGLRDIRKEIENQVENIEGR